MVELREPGGRFPMDLPRAVAYTSLQPKTRQRPRAQLYRVHREWQGRQLPAAQRFAGPGCGVRSVTGAG